LNFPKDHNELPMVQELLAVSTDIAAILENSNEQTAIRLLESNKLTAANLKKFNDEMHEVTSISI
jgi:predicted house-cleaning noncanonical NTP pyrophosphatase (MazG superfamily)